jgi:hypothetical protein
MTRTLMEKVSGRPVAWATAPAQSANILEISIAEMARAGGAPNARALAIVKNCDRSKTITSESVRSAADNS